MTPRLVPALCVLLAAAAVSEAQTFTLTATADPVVEGNSGTRLAPIRLTIAPPVPAGSQVRVRLISRDGVDDGVIGAARSGRDYIPLSTTITFMGGGSSSATANVLIIGDTVRENTEQFFVDLTVIEPVGEVTLNPATVTMTILNDDPLPLGSVFGIQGVRSVEFEASNAFGTFSQRPGSYGDAVAGTFMDTGQFAIIESRESVYTCRMIDTLTLLPSLPVFISGLPTGGVVADLDFDPRAGSLILMAAADSSTSFGILDSASGMVSELGSIQNSESWRGFAVHPLTGDFLLVGNTGLWRWNPVSEALTRQTTQPFVLPAQTSRVVVDAARGRLYTIQSGNQPALLAFNPLSGARVERADIQLPVEGISALDFQLPSILPEAWAAFRGDLVVEEPDTSEGGAVMEVLLEPALSRATTIELQVASGSAVLGTHFAEPSQSQVVIPPLATSAALTFPILRDPFPSAPVDFVARFSSESGIAAAYPEALITILDGDQELALSLESFENWTIDHLDGDPLTGFRQLGTAAPAGWTNRAIEFFPTTGASVSDTALISPPVDLSVSGWVQVSWRQALEHRQATVEVLPLLEFSLNHGNGWTPLILEDVLPQSPRGTISKPLVYTIDATPFVAGHSDVRFRMRVRNVALDRLMIDDWKMSIASLDPGRALAWLPNQILTANLDEASEFVTVQIRPALANEVVLTLSEPNGASEPTSDYDLSDASVVLPAGSTEASIPIRLFGATGPHPEIQARLLLSASRPDVRGGINNLTIQRVQPLAGPVASLLGSRGLLHEVSIIDPRAIATRNLSSHLTSMSDWSTRGSDGRFIWSLETTPIPRIHQFDLRTERWVRQGLLPPNLPPGPIRGFSWNPTLVGWTVLIGTPGAYHLVGLSESGDEVIESLRLLAGASNLAGLVVSDAGVVYTVRIHGGLPQLATINPTEGTLTPLLDLDIAVSDKATLAIDPASGDLYIAIPFSEGAFAPIPSQLARYDVASSEAENLGVLGSSFLNFSGFTFIPAERGAASEGWFLH